MNVHINEVVYQLHDDGMMVKLFSMPDGKKMVKFMDNADHPLLIVPYNEFAYIFDKFNKLF